MTVRKNSPAPSADTAQQGEAARARLLRSLPLREHRRDLAGISTTLLDSDGDRPPLILLHGPGASSTHWMRVIPALSRRYRVIAPDLPGHGSSALGSAALDADHTLAWLEALIEATCAAPPILVGELVGGAIAARFAARNTTGIAQLVLVDSFGLQPFRPEAGFATALGAFGANPNPRTHQDLWALCAHSVDTLREELGELWPAFEAYNVACARSPNTQAAVASLMAEFALPAISAEELAQITCPTCLIWGRHDLATPLAAARRASAGFGFPLHVIEGANDAPAMERPRAFLDALFGELSTAPREPGRSSRRRERVDTLVIGGGQAGLATSYWLGRAGMDHLVIERRPELGGAWHDRWDSFHLVAPNFCLLLPGMPYDGPKPQAFMPRAEVVEYVRAYGEFCAAPVRFGCNIDHLSRSGGSFEAVAGNTTFVAHNVVLATGPYQKPKTPDFSRAIAPHVQQLHSHDYRRPAQLAPGGVLVVGSGQSGTQIAEELHRAGREVHLAVSMCFSIPRRYRGQDVIWWLLKSFQNRERFGLPFPMVNDLPTPAARFACNPHCTGVDGGHDIHLRVFARRGIHLYGRLESGAGVELQFSDDLAERLTFADTRFDEEVRPLFDAYIAAAGVDAPPDDRKTQGDFLPSVVTRLNLDQAGIRSVIWATGYQLDFSWVDLPILDEWGYPKHVRGVTEQAGLYAVGLPWLYSEPSSVFAGVGDDARYVVDHVAEHRSTLRALG